MKKTLLALAVSLAAVSGAHASWDSGATTDGEALLMVIDKTAQTSYVQDLNVTYSQLYSGAAFTGSPISLYTAGLTSIFGASYASNANLSWGVVASGGDANDATHWGLVQTVNGVQQISGDPGALAGQIGQANGGVGGWSAATIFGTLPAGYVTGSASTSPATYAGRGEVLGFITPYGFSTINGSGTQDLWLQGFTPDYSGTVEQKIGTVSLNLSSNTVAFGTATAPSVPVPAAAWLLGSALAGLGGIARKRKQA